MEQDEMLNFVKALAHADRLRVVGVLTKSSATALQVAHSLGLPFRDAVNHLMFLEHIGMVRSIPAKQKQDDVYELMPEGVEKAARQHFSDQRESYTPSPNLDKKARKVLAAYLNADGAIKQLPNQPSKLQVILDYILEAFTPGVIYTEKEVNMVIRRFHLDTAGLRRDLIDRGMLERKSDGSQYWRPK
jgi:hypothetical protein